MAEPNWQPRRWVWGFWAGLPCLAIIPFAWLRDSHALLAEDGFIEIYQDALWLISGVAGVIIALFYLREKHSRWATFILGIIAFVALARELDFHTRLNPEYLGDWGVRYRIDWWLDGNVSFLLKAAWAGIGIVVAGAFGFALSRAWSPIDWRKARPRLLAATILCTAIAFAMDDLLRGQGITELRVFAEEGSEALGAVCYLAAVLTPGSATRHA